MKYFFRFAYIISLSTFLFFCPNSNLKSEILPSEKTRHGNKIKNAFEQTVQKSANCVVEIEINGSNLTNGTIVEINSSNQTGLTVCKASLLGEFVSEEDTFRYRGVQGKWQPARFIGYEKDLDLAFLEIDTSSSEQLNKIPLALSTNAGQWLISIGYGEKQPLGIGVLGAEPREIDSSQGVVGLNVDETKQGLSITKVLANSSASRAGLHNGDRLMLSKDEIAKKRRWLSKLLRQHNPGDWLTVFAKRGETVLSFDLQIGTPWNSVFHRQAMMNRFGSDVSQRRTGFRSVFQHDTLIHPKNCGGPIVNLKGELVGVNIARAGRTDTFAVPVKEILETAKKFQKTH